MVDEAENSDVEALKPSPPSQVWIYGINDHLDFDEERVAAFQTTGDFCRDYPAMCKELGVVAHTSFASPQRFHPRNGDNTTNEDAHPHNLIVSANSILMDKISVEILRSLLPRCHELNTIKFSHCKVDIEMMHVLRQGLDDRSTIQTLQIDWNPVEVPLEFPDDNEEDPIELTGPLLDQLESAREAKQNRRLLSAFKERLLDFGVGLEHEENALMLPALLDLDQFMTFFDAKRMTGDDICEIFEVLDGPFHGGGSGSVRLQDLQDALNEINKQAPKSGTGPASGTHTNADGEQQQQHEEEKEAAAAGEPERDAVGECFATFLDADCCVENISFRHCALTRTCMEPMARALLTNQHIRILNLWGNRLNDGACVSLAPVLAVHSGMQFLGLGRNWITHRGLEALQEYIACEVRDPTEAQLRIKEQEVEAQKNPTPMLDPAGRERWRREVVVDQLEQRVAEAEAEGGEAAEAEAADASWIWRRNTTLQILHVGENRIQDAEAVGKLIPLGTGTLVLTGNPCVPLMRDSAPKVEEGVPGWKLHL